MCGCSSGILELMRPAILVSTFGLAVLGLLVFPVRSQEPQQGPTSTVTTPSAISQIPSSVPGEDTPGVTVVLDPAHGGTDFGARGPTGLAESDVVLDFARAARVALEAERLRVLLTREGNQDPSFENRSALVNGLRHAIFISLHVSSTGPVGTGRTYYCV